MRTLILGIVLSAVASVAAAQFESTPAPSGKQAERVSSATTPKDYRKDGARHLYAQYGFTPLSAPDRIMEVLRPDIYRSG